MRQMGDNVAGEWGPRDVGWHGIWFEIWDLNRNQTKRKRNETIRKTVYV